MTGIRLPVEYPNAIPVNENRPCLAPLAGVLNNLACPRFATRAVLAMLSRSRKVDRDFISDRQKPGEERAGLIGKQTGTASLRSRSFWRRKALFQGVEPVRDVRRSLLRRRKNTAAKFVQN